MTYVPKILATFIICFSASTGIAQGTDEQLTSEQWLQRFAHVQPGQTTDTIRQSLRNRFYQSDVDGGGVTEKDFELRATVQNAQSRGMFVGTQLGRDLDGDGRITKDELEKSFSQQANQLLNSNGIRVAPTPAQSAEILARLVDEALKADKSRDGVITLDEMVADYDRKQGRALMSNRVDADRLILKLDADGDGTVTLQEFDAAVDRLIATIDKDRDGSVSDEEFKAATDAGRASEKAYREWIRLQQKPQGPQEP